MPNLDIIPNLDFMSKLPDLSFISAASNYIILIMCVIYAFSSFAVFLPSSRKRQVKRMDRQELFMFIFHFICYGVLLLQTKQFVVILLYLAQAVFFKLLIFIYQHVYPECSRIMMNHICFLLLIGFVMLTRLSLEKAVKQFGIVAAASIVALVIPVFVEKAYWLKKLRWFYGLAGLLLLATVFVIGTTKNGSTNWISLGGFAFQPSEFVKISYVFFIAAMLERIKSFKQIFITAAFCAGHVLVLILERDLGGALLYFVVFIFMCYVSTGRMVYLVGGAAAGAVAARIAYQFFGHVKTRFIAWLDPWSCIDQQGYQIAQSLFAIGTGGWFGLGLAHGRPGDIPVVESDFIFSAIAEEFGVFFAICLILIYLSVFLHFITIATDSEDRFYKLLAYGFSMTFIFQVFLSVGGVTKFIPSTGVTLPLISYGGSSVVSTLIIFAIMQGIFVLTYRIDVQEEGEEYVERRAEAADSRYQPEKTVRGFLRRNR